MYVCQLHGEPDNFMNVSIKHSLLPVAKSMLLKYVCNFIRSMLQFSFQVVFLCVFMFERFGSLKTYLLCMSLPTGMRTHTLIFLLLGSEIKKTRQIIQQR